jgi:hypothetical protein
MEEESEQTKDASKRKTSHVLQGELSEEKSHKSLTSPESPALSPVEI